jgi:hypothetical protein
MALSKDPLIFKGSFAFGGISLPLLIGSISMPQRQTYGFSYAAERKKRSLQRSSVCACRSSPEVEAAVTFLLANTSRK